MVLFTLNLALAAGPACADAPAAFARTALLAPADATPSRLDELKAAGYGTIALMVAPEFATLIAEKHESDDWIQLALDSHARFNELFVHTDVSMGRRACRICVGFRDGVRAAAAAVRARGLQLGWWLEVGRQPALAEVFPDLVGSLQGNGGWKRRFQDPPSEDDTHVVKCWPWLTVMSREALVLHQAWICSLAQSLPPGDVVYLNDLQGSPSACGCGNLQCRWIADYGERRTSTPVEADAAAQLVRSVREAFARRAGGGADPGIVAPVASIVPVWASECESSDGAPDGHCSGVPCFDSACWPELWKQLYPVEVSSPTIGLLLLSKSFERSGADDRAGAAWIGPAIAALGAADARREGPPIRAGRVVAILEAADRAPEAVAAEIAAAEKAGAGGVVVSFSKLEQAFEPRRMLLPK